MLKNIYELPYERVMNKNFYQNSKYQVYNFCGLWRTCVSQTQPGGFLYPQQQASPAAWSSLPAHFKHVAIKARYLHV